MDISLFIEALHDYLTPASYNDQYFVTVASKIGYNIATTVL